MIRKLMVILLAGAICLLGAFPVLAQEMRMSQQYNTLEEYQKITGEKIEKFSESPMLRTKVAAGELPPVEKRLAEEPIVIKPAEEIGQYGGTWRMVSVERANLGWHVYQFIGYEEIVRGAPDYSSVIPNIAKSWDVSDDGRVFTFHLRKGMRWSDGMPFTADDIMFWYGDVTLNKELTPVFPDWFTLEGVPGRVEKIDDYTVKFVFAKPYGIFLDTFARGIKEPFLPKHYMKKFHPNYTPIEKLEKMTKEAEFDNWFELFEDKNDFWGNPERPTLYAWRVVVPFGVGVRVSLERNPYYWKVDTEGNQLPYIDEVAVSIVTKAEIAELKGVSGEIDIQASPVLDNIGNYPMFMENRKRGNYRIQKMPVGWNDIAFYFNFNCKDPILRKIFRDRRFRIAMSHAINRQEMMYLIYPGRNMKIAQVSPSPGSPWYYEPLEKQYLEYDPQRANQLLDEIGLDKRDANGWRLRPDGKILAFTMEVPSFTKNWIDTSELIIRHWQKVGIKATLKVEDPGLWSLRCIQTGEDDGTFCGCGDDAGPPLRYREYVPIRQEWGLCLAAPLWALWHQTNGKSGEEPPPEIKKIMKLYDKITVTPDRKKQVELAREIIKINAENFWIGGICRRPGKMVIIKNYVRNVPENLSAKGWTEVGPGNFCQCFFKR